jgi:hypothetical protein
MTTENEKMHLADVTMKKEVELENTHYTEKEMLDFAWFVVENAGKIFSCDRTAHFEGAFLRMFKKLKNGNNTISNQKEFFK